mmetsp:Transcript_87756/g.246593  ORF Transcript_87756/g.246593 Transcript_87756/m.246593 type:complete len:262 (+) Transcript_87756:76-861(+)
MGARFRTAAQNPPAPLQPPSPPPRHRGVERRGLVFPVRRRPEPLSLWSQANQPHSEPRRPPPAEVSPQLAPRPATICARRPRETWGQSAVAAAAKAAVAGAAAASVAAATAVAAAAAAARAPAVQVRPWHPRASKLPAPQQRRPLRLEARRLAQPPRARREPGSQARRSRPTYEVRSQRPQGEAPLHPVPQPPRAPAPRPPGLALGPEMAPPSQGRPPRSRRKLPRRRRDRHPAVRPPSRRPAPRSWRSESAGLPRDRQPL